MRRTTEQIEQNLINDDRLLLLMLVEEQRETNRLLAQLVNARKPNDNEGNKVLNRKAER